MSEDFMQAPQNMLRNLVGILGMPDFIILGVLYFSTHGCVWNGEKLNESK